MTGKPEGYGLQRHEVFWIKYQSSERPIGQSRGHVFQPPKCNVQNGWQAQFLAQCPLPA